METAHKWGDKKAEAVKAQQDKVAESESKGHGKRLAQRKRHVVTLKQELKDAKAQMRDALSKPQPWVQLGSGPIVTSASRRS